MTACWLLGPRTGEGLPATEPPRLKNGHWLPLRSPPERPVGASVVEGLLTAGADDGDGFPGRRTPSLNVSH